MAPFLQAMFGRGRTSFVFVMRHPLTWALVAAKWGCVWQPPPTDPAAEVDPDDAAAAATHSKASGAKAPTLDCLAHLVDVWLAVHEALAVQLPTLHSAALLSAESDEWLGAPAWLAAVGGGVLPRSLEDAGGGTAHKWALTQASFRAASHSYVHCFLRGFAPRRARVAGGNCGSETGRLTAVAAEVRTTERRHRNPSPQTLFATSRRQRMHRPWPTAPAFAWHSLLRLTHAQRHVVAAPHVAAAVGCAGRHKGACSGLLDESECGGCELL